MMPRLTAAAVRAHGAAGRLLGIVWFRRALALLVFSAAGFFLAQRIGAIGLASVTANAGPSSLLALGVSALLYAGGLILLALAWGLVASAGGRFPGGRAVIGAYGLSVLPKYIPGSVFQYVSRQALGAKLGWPQRAIARASAIEAALHLLCAALIALVFFAPPLGIAAAFGVAALLWRFAPTESAIPAACALQLVFFALTAGLVVLIAPAAGIASDAAPRVAAAYLVAWIAGFLVPVAPGGIGVREAVGVALMEGAVGTDAILVLVAMMRIVNLLGDLAMVAIAAPCRAGAQTGTPLPRT